MRVRDNGVRSFVPPTFRFELLDPADGSVVATVSRVVLPSGGPVDDDAVAALDDGGMGAVGEIVGYEVGGPGGRATGLSFEITGTRLTDASR